jgi:hypothetical protein
LRGERATHTYDVWDQAAQVLRLMNDQATLLELLLCIVRFLVSSLPARCVCALAQIVFGS